MLRRCMVQVPAWQVLAAPISQLLRTLLREDEEAAGRGGNQRDASAPDHKPLPPSRLARPPEAGESPEGRNGGEGRERRDDIRVLC